MIVVVVDSSVVDEADIVVDEAHTAAEVDSVVDDDIGPSSVPLGNCGARSSIEAGFVSMLELRYCQSCWGVQERFASVPMIPGFARTYGILRPHMD